MASALGAIAAQASRTTIQGPRKWLLDYSLAVQVSTNPVQYIYINPPMTIEFDVKRADMADGCDCNIRIYNLGSNTRNKIRIDQVDFNNLFEIKFIAGYNPQYGLTPFRGITTDDSAFSNLNLPLIFRGVIQRAYSEREGESFVTTIIARDNGFIVNAQDIAYSKAGENLTNRTIVKDMVDYLSQFGVSPGAIGNYPGSPGRGVTYSGKATEILGQITGHSYFTDLGHLHCLPDDQALDIGYGSPLPDIQLVPVINSQSGLLGTPQIQRTIINVDMIFSPEFRVAQLVKLDSTTAADASLNNQAIINSLCRVKGISHKGTISDAVASQTTTHLVLFPGQYTTVGVQSG